MQSSLSAIHYVQPATEKHPAFEFLRPILSRIDFGDTLRSLNTLARERAVDLKFVGAPPGKVAAVDYETRIVTSRELIVSDTPHDHFNACIWLTFPKTKRVISEIHVELGRGENNRRPRRRDVLTLSDESGLILLCAESHYEAFQRLNAAHEWQTLFVKRRAEFSAHVKPLLFGHGALEQLATRWHRGLTVKAMWLPQPSNTSLESVDEFLSSQIRANQLLCEDERRIPMPILGVPGWFHENEDPRCYEDADVFRSMRHR
jgi:hypothetical protein